jgi:hypothetical protein
VDPGPFDCFPTIIDAAALCPLLSSVGLLLLELGSMGWKAYGILNFKNYVLYFY